ncbi:MAG: class I SAM-dependent methyltransferase [Candidatus Scalindua sp. AMX11]|nr:MAG: class I SAM-dependent methyltransferase [Candidatus Scalindua sp.]NOG84118.1 class I SAM-dependent methyltransferase [Planctomycetota bacterium]RZV98972.1 MAG: class I SAM-dependent methyltransferase [Candidatus Scalindua sp. SCAELEC01]TDE66836.1 MAG: class I SAM-dependent methyltransferase [Candidatus Scalindua sp. AMX11]GJQ57635.1 MAG: hypothetical protein SCALA701_04360 [Candidatus Scalindua sp.]
MISKKLNTEITRNISESNLGVRDESPEDSLSFISSDKYLRSQAAYYVSVMNQLKINPTAKKILEIGSGYCFFLVYAYKTLKWDIYGIEPGKDEFEGRCGLALSYLKENGVNKERLMTSFGEDSTLPSNCYDVIISNDVLEHVRDVADTIDMAFRVLKPGGVMIFNIPNYRWFYEGHYNIVWLPFLSKTMAKKYVRLWGRDPRFIEYLNFLTPRIIKQIVQSIPNMNFCLPLEYKTAEFMAERANAYVESKGKKNVKPLIKLLTLIASLKTFRIFMGGFSKLTGCYHEMHMVVTKSTD